MTCKITVEVVYALLEKQYLHRVTLEAESTVEEAIHKSGLLELRRDIDLMRNKIGIYNQLVDLKYKINDGDRIEIYRPLITDLSKLNLRNIRKKTK